MDKLCPQYKKTIFIFLVFFYLYLKSQHRLWSYLCMSQPSVADSSGDLLALITLTLTQTRLLCKGTGLFLENAIRENTHSSPPQALAQLCWFHHVGERKHMDYMLCWLEHRKVWIYGEICYFVINCNIFKWYNMLTVCPTASLYEFLNSVMQMDKITNMWSYELQ